MVGGANTGPTHNSILIRPVSYSALVPAHGYHGSPSASCNRQQALLVKLPDVVPMAFRSSPVAYWLTTTSPTSYSAAPFRLKMNHFLGYPSRFLLCLNMTGPTTLSCLKCLGRRPREYKLQFGGSRSLNSRMTLFTIRFETIQVSSLEIADILTIIG